MLHLATSGSEEQRLHDFRHGENSITAVPPADVCTNDSSQIMGRLRSCSEGHRQGMITEEEKYMLKRLIISRDPRLPEDLERALYAGDHDRVRHMIHNLVSMGNKDSDSLMNHLSEVSWKLPQSGSGPCNLQIHFKVDDEDEDLCTTLFDPLFDALAVETEDHEGYYAFQDTQFNELHQRYQDDSKKNVPDFGAYASRKRQAPREQSTNQCKSSQQSIAGSVPSNEVKRIKPENAVTETPDVNKVSRLSCLKPSLDGSFMRHLRTLSAGTSARKSLDKLAGTKDVTSKHKKNERERKRRLAVSQGFEELANMLKTPDDCESAAQTSKIDKATILKRTIETIKALNKRVANLERQNALLKQSRRKH